MTFRCSGGARRRGGWSSTLAIIGGLGVVGLALILVPRLLLPPPPLASTSPTPAETPTPAPQVSFAPSPYLGIDWRITLLRGDSQASVAALVESNGWLVAVGTTAGSPAAWWSEDQGETWTIQGLGLPDSPPSETARAEPRTLAAGPDGLIATGIWYEPGSGEVLQTVAWASRDGRAWMSAELTGLEAGSMLDQVYGTPAGFYAIGFSQARGQSWWYAMDGLAWQAIEPFGINQVAFGRPAVASAHDLVVLGSGVERRRRPHPAIFAAIDWLNWERVYEADEETYGLVWGMAAFDEGFIAVGTASQESDWQRYGHAAAWLSNDGRGWQPLDLDATPESNAAMVAASPGGAVTLGWSSADGSERAYFMPYGGTPSSVAIPFNAQGLVALRDRFIAVGSCLGEVPCGVVVAIGTLSASAVTTEPTLPPFAD